VDKETNKTTKRHTVFKLLMRLPAAWFAAVVMVWAMHELGWPEPFVVNASASMPRGVWVLTGHDEAPSRGEIVTLEAPERARELGCVRDGQVLLKYVVGVPGDRVCVRGGEVDVEGLGEPITTSSLLGEHGARGEGVPSTLEGCFELGPGQIWVGAPHPRSCDSRYFGPVARERVRSRARAWLTLEHGHAQPPGYPPRPRPGTQHSRRQP
jgi:type IV secretory pathway protease TraF